MVFVVGARHTSLSRGENASHGGLRCVECSSLRRSFSCQSQSVGYEHLTEEHAVASSDLCYAAHEYDRRRNSVYIVFVN